MREISENDLRWFAARLSIAVEETKRYGGMSVQDMKQALRDVPGVEGLTMAYTFDGNALLTIGGRTVEASPAMSSDEIAAAFSATVTPLPPAIAYAATPTTRIETMTTKPAPGSFAAGIRAMMDEARQGVAQARADGLSKVGEAVGKLNDAKVATTHVAGKMASVIEDEAADVMAELGQISNDLGLSAE